MVVLTFNCKSLEYTHLSYHIAREIYKVIIHPDTEHNEFDKICIYTQWTEPDSRLAIVTNHT